MIDKGADVMYAERFGVSDAAKERKVLAIGNVIDTQKDYPDTVVASALWHMEPDHRRGHQGGQGRQFKAEDYGHLSMMKAVQGQFAEPAGHAVREEGAGRPAGQGAGQGEGDPRTDKFTQ